MGDIHAENRALPPFKRAANEEESHQPSSASADSNKENIFYGLAHGQGKSAGFKITFTAGNTAAIYYHDIISPIKYDGTGTIELRTPMLILTIKGKNIQSLFDYLFENRLACIKEPGSSFIQTKEGEPEIESITLELKD